MLHRLFYGIISFFCFTWLLVSWGVVSNGRIELIKMTQVEQMRSIRKSKRLPSPLMTVRILLVRLFFWTDLQSGM